MVMNDIGPYVGAEALNRIAKYAGVEHEFDTTRGTLSTVAQHPASAADGAGF